jgi:hypothetical protein
MNNNNEPIPSLRLTDEMKTLMDNKYIEIRKEEQNKLLMESGKYVLPDFPIILENKMLILNYHEDLRNFNYSDFSLTLPQFPI